jgi:predicted phage terminase large subunit-like protein
MTPSLFACNYELKIIADENALFTNAIWLPANESERIYGGRAHIDAAYDGEDYTAFTILKKESDGGYVGYGKIWRKHVDQCLDEIEALHSMYKAGSITCETNADKGYLAKELKARGFETHSYAEHQNKFIKISTILRKHWKHIRWIDDTDPEYISQILDYTEDATHDDAPDSCASLLRAMENGAKVNTNSYLRGGI